MLEVVARARFSWTSVLGPGFRPSDLSGKDGCESLPFTAIVTFADAGNGQTAYRAVALHRNEADKATHENMGFHDGWGTVARQLEEYAQSLSANA